MSLRDKVILFSKKVDLPQSPQTYPSGICVETERGNYFINGKYRHHISTKRVLESWSFPFVVKASEAAVSKYVKAKPLGFRDGTIVRAVSDGKLYIISQREKRHITNPDFLGLLGLTKGTPIWVSDKELNLHQEGEVIS